MSLRFVSSTLHPDRSSIPMKDPSMVERPHAVGRTQLRSQKEFRTNAVGHSTCMGGAKPLENVTIGQRCLLEGCMVWLPATDQVASLRQTHHLG
jgi:hypothetical protein